MRLSPSSWLGKRVAALAGRGSARHRPPLRRRAAPLRLERLEDRTLLSGPPVLSPAPLAPTGSFTGIIRQVGEVDAFQVTVPADTPDGLLTVQARPEDGSPLQVRLSLYGTDAGLGLVAQSDGQSPTDHEAVLAQHLRPGTYTIQVQALAGTGAYTLTTDFSPAIPPFQSLPTGTVSAKCAAGDLNGDGIADLVVCDYFNNDVVVLLGKGDGTFQDDGSVSVDGPTTSVVIGDFNGDHIPDLVTANQTDLSVSVLLGKGDGSFRDPIRTPVPTLPFDLVAADLNRDGQLDLVATSTTSNDVTVLLGRGDGSFQVKGSYTVGFGNSGAVAADLNGDGVPDLVTSNFLSHDLSVLLGTGDGGFAPATTIDLGADTLPSGVTSADFNGDGIPDLAASDFTTNDVSVLLGEGGGRFRDPVRWAVGPNPNDAVAADFNGDGFVDLATPNFGTNDVSVLLGNGDGTFRDVGKRFGVGTTPYGLITADFNGDHIPDLAAVNIVSRDVSVLTGLGDGTFLDQDQSAVATSPSVVVSADFNGDGIPDLAAADFGSSDVAVLLGRGDGTFENQVRFPTDVNPLSVTVGDFNGDGIPDLATANVSSYTASVLLGNGDGTFQKARSFPVGISPFAVAAGDFNRDGHPDLVVANRASGDLSVLLGNGDGTFQPARSFPVQGEAPMALAVKDFNGDGKPDIAVADFGSGVVSVLLGNGDGSFTFENTFQVGKGPIFLIADDFNADGALDLAVSNNLSNTVSVLLGNGDGTFRGQIELPTGEQPRSLLAGDFNHDGFRDLAVANLGARTASQSAGVSVFLGDGRGAFAEAAGSPFPAGPGLWGLAAGDFNGDGTPDLAASNITANGVTVLQGQGDGTFAQQGHFAVGTGPVPLATADFNRDGRPDVARADYNAGTVTVLTGGGDGALQPSAVVRVGQGPTAVAAADLNGDGRTDLVTANYLSGTVSVLLGLGDGTFQAPVSFPAGPTPSALAVGDFDRDGHTDLAVTSDQAGTVTVLFGQANGTYRQGMPLAVGQHPDALAAGDFNGDGIPDLAGASYGSHTVQVLLGNGDGSFPPQAPVDIGAGAVALIAGDFDGDGRLDLAAADYTTQKVAILWGRGDGSFAGPDYWGVGAGPTWLVAGDFTGDGRTDVACADNVSGDVSLLAGQGSRRFLLAPPIPVGDFPFALAAADFNGDGRLDLAAATQLSTAVSVLVGQGGGSFFPAGAISAPVRSTPLVADLNGDGLADVMVLSRDGRILYRQRRPEAAGAGDDFDAPVVINPDPRFAARELAVIRTRNGPVLAALDATAAALSFYTPRPDGSFVRTPGPAVPGFLPAALVVGDLNGDGLSDLVVAAAGSGQVFVYLQSADPGAGTTSPLFGPPTHVNQVGAGPTALTLADMDGDGSLDIVAADQLSGDVSILLNTPGRPFGAVTRFRAGPGPYGTAPLSGTTVVRSQLGTTDVVAGRFGAGSGLDLVVINSARDGFSLLPGDGFGGVFNPVSAPAFTTGLGPAAVVSGLLNGDAFPDLAILDEGSSQLSVFAGDGRGGFTRTFTTDAGNRPTGLTLADVNGDGLPDLLVGNEFGDVLILLGDGDGTFKPYQRVGRNIALAVADLDGDGRADFVLGNESLDRVTVEYSRPGESFVRGRGDGLLAPGAVTAADLNGDGIPDLIVVNSGGNDVLVYPGLGDGQFGPAHTAFVGTDPVGVTVADVNGDHIPDLLVANEGSNDVSVLLGHGSGAGWDLTPGVRLQAGGVGPVSTTVADVTGPQGAPDGIPDLLVVNSQSDTVAVLPGLSSGFFNDSRPQILNTGSDPRQVLAGHFDGRSDPELITVNAGSNDLSFFPGLGAGVSISAGGEEPVSAVVGRLNGDGFDDVLIANNRDGLITVLFGGAAGLGVPVSLPGLALTHPTGLVLSDDAAVLYVAQEGQEEVTVIHLHFGGGSGGAVPSPGPGVVPMSGFFPPSGTFGGEEPEVVHGPPVLAVLFIGQSLAVENEPLLPVTGAAEPQVVGLSALRESSPGIVVLVLALDEPSLTEEHDPGRAYFLPDLTDPGMNPNALDGDVALQRLPEEDSTPPAGPLEILPPARDDGGPLDPRLLPAALQGREQIIPDAADFARHAAVLPWPAGAAAEAEPAPATATAREAEGVAPVAARGHESARRDHRRPVALPVTAAPRTDEANGDTPSRAAGLWWIDADHPQGEELAEAFPAWAAGRRVGLAEAVTAALIAGAAVLCRGSAQGLDCEERADRRRAHPRR